MVDWNFTKSFIASKLVVGDEGAAPPLGPYTTVLCLNSSSGEKTVFTHVLEEVWFIHVNI